MKKTTKQPRQGLDQEQNQNSLLLNNLQPSILIGWREWVTLPNLGIASLKTKVDTGAKTSALHACSLEIIEIDSIKKVRFSIRTRRDSKEAIQCISNLIAMREVTDSGGHKEKRCVIKTLIQLGSQCWPIEITLTNRDNMCFRMLLGRTALRRRFIVNPSSSYLYSKKL